MDFDTVLNSLHYDRMIFEIQYGGKLSMARKARMTLSGIDNPFVGRSYSTSYYKESDEKASVYVSCQKFNNKFLGYPHNSRSCPKSNDSYENFKCHGAYLTRYTMKHLNRKMFHSFHFIPEDSLMISASMVRNKTIMNMYSNWLNQCHA